MEPPLKTLKADLEAIRDRAMNALKQIEQSQENRSMRWECNECEYITFHEAGYIGNCW
jgi:hypothetical protein